jgi:hypothetical protein
MSLPSTHCLHRSPNTRPRGERAELSAARPRIKELEAELELTRKASELFEEQQGRRVVRPNEVLGMWFQASEGAKFWMQLLSDLKQRGVQDILIACVEGLKGFPEAIFAPRRCRPASSI